MDRQFTANHTVPIARTLRNCWFNLAPPLKLLNWTPKVRSVISSSLSLSNEFFKCHVFTKAKLCCWLSKPLYRYRFLPRVCVWKFFLKGNFMCLHSFELWRYIDIFLCYIIKLDGRNCIRSKLSLFQRNLIDSFTHVRTTLLIHPIFSYFGLHGKLFPLFFFLWLLISFFA